MKSERNGSISQWRHAARWLLVVPLLLLFASCSTVKSKRDSGDVTESAIESARELEGMANLLELPFAVVGNVATSTGQLLQSGEKYSKKGQTDDAAGSFLKAAVESRELLIAQKEVPNSEAERVLLNLHNSSLARFAEVWGNDPRRYGPAPYQLSSEGTKYEIRLDPSSDFDAGFFDEAISADGVKGKGVEAIRREGLGAPLVGVRHRTPEREKEMSHFPPKGLFMPITLTIAGTKEVGSGEERRTLVSLAIHNPMETDRVPVNGRSVPLAANFSAPILLLADGENEQILGLFGFLNARKVAAESGIFLMEPYDPDRIPVILTHGLISAPIIWRNIAPELMSEPEISKRYQLMAFRYPSSYAIGESARFMRDELAELRAHYDPDGNDPLSNNVVAMGHSMGGILTHMLVTDFDDRIWTEISDLEYDSLPFKPEIKEDLDSLLFFDYDPAVERAVFISTPHRGANMATSSLAGAVSQMAKLPSNMLTSTRQLLDGPLPEGIDFEYKGKVTSVQSLRPDYPLLIAMDKSPFKPGVNYHSIIGDRGKGDSPDSSDGVVEYWSSHLEGADSELIVPTDHGAYKDPGAIEELKRILRLHAGI